VVNQVLLAVLLAVTNVDANANVNANANVLVEKPPTPLVKRPLFWLTVIGGAAVIAAGITISIVLNPPRDPTPTWGVGIGN
jgi:hypothetical protein